MSLEIIQKLRELETEGYVNSSEYKDLILFNYSDQCTFSRHWNEYTLEARGTIYNKTTGKIVARGFQKFFNYSEMGITEETLPKCPFVATIKIDGSLGVVRTEDDEIKVSTRGSFYSEQAVEATKMANESPYKEAFKEMLMHGTPLVEIIYPENQIIVRYGDQRKLVVLAIRRLDGTYLSPRESEDIAHAHGLEHTMIVGNVPLEELLRLQKIINWQEEGWVLVYEDGTRVKIKGSDYMRIAKIKSCLSPISVWEAMEVGKAEQYISSMPDEIHDEAKAIYNNLMSQYYTLTEETLRVAERLKVVAPQDYKSTAISIQKNAPKWMHPSLYALMRGQSMVHFIVGILRPTGNKYVSLKEFL